jgi:hypothetical protein
MSGFACHLNRPLYISIIRISSSRLKHFIQLHTFLLHSFPTLTLHSIAKHTVFPLYITGTVQTSLKPKYSDARDKFIGQNQCLVNAHNVRMLCTKKGQK